MRAIMEYIEMALAVVVIPAGCVLMFVLGFALFS